MDPKTLAFLMGAAGGASKLYVEDVFSTWLYTGNGSTQTITNGIDLSGKGGLVWTKSRSAATLNSVFDTNRGVSNYLHTSSTGAAYSLSNFGITSFTSTGFTVADDTGGSYVVNGSGSTYASWTFRKAAKFFDVVTYTGIGSARTIAHNLGSVPGCIIVKRTDGADAWFVYHRSTGAFAALLLNATDAAFGNNNYWNNTAPTSSVFSVGTDPRCNASGGTYVAYLFAHDAGGFGDSGNDSVISCGSYTGNGSATGPTVTLGWEPQWLLIKRTDNVGDWNLIDNMRGFVVGGTDAELNANLTNSESTGIFVTPLPTGFQLNTTSTEYNASGGGYMYIAIRRGPMKTPTDATKVHSQYSGTPTDGTLVTTNFPVDFLFQKSTGFTSNWGVIDRLRGYAATSADTQPRLQFNTTNAEEVSSDLAFAFDNVSYKIGGSQIVNIAGISHAFRRAPGFFDVVAFTGVYASTAYSHNLGVTPEMIILKRRSNLSDWIVYHTGVPSPLTNQPALNLTGGYYANSYFSASPTSTQFSAQYLYADNWVAYLFASCPGVSKVGSYTGTGTTLSVDCGFTNGSRFVMIKRTDATGDWYVWDTARGIIAANDPYLLLNSTAAEVTITDYIDPLSSGFQISSTAPAAINASGGTFIFLAIA